MSNLEYYLRDVPTLITENLYLGSFYYARQSDKLVADGIKHIICLTGDEPHPVPDGITVTHFPCFDNPKEDILSFFERTCAIIHEALLKKEKIFVHCVAGVSRSATIVLAYLIKHGIDDGTPMNFLEALMYVAQKRQQISPNYGFIKQLRIWEEQLSRHRLDNSVDKSHPEEAKECP